MGETHWRSEWRCKERWCDVGCARQDKLYMLSLSLMIIIRALEVLNVECCVCGLCLCLLPIQSFFRALLLEQPQMLKQSNWPTASIKQIFNHKFGINFSTCVTWSLAGIYHN